MIVTESYPLLVHSWIIQSSCIFIKKMDRSVFLHHGTGIPREIRKFFGVENIKIKEKIYITIKYHENYYKAYIECDNINRTRLMWHSDLSFIINNQLPNWSHYFKTFKEIPDIFPEMYFIKENDGLYNVQFIDYAVNWTHGKPQTIKEKEIETFELNEFFNEKVGRKGDYLERAAFNSKLGFLGESFIMNYERNNLNKLQRPDLSERVEHVSVTIGDGLGFDILSFQSNGEPRFIEVKTTVNQKESFYITNNELNFSKDYSGHYYLYRITNFNWQNNAGNIYIRQGNLYGMLEMKPILYEGKFL